MTERFRALDGGVVSLASSPFCPNCNADLRGDPIPEESREHYGGKTHFRRVIGVEYQGGFDGISEWRCPDCGYREGRWTGRALSDDEFEPRYGGEGGTD